ncbi:MAG TPA: hypothetical protein VGB52_13945, partial [Actinomycetota bacterium]
MQGVDCLACPVELAFRAVPDVHDQDAVLRQFRVAHDPYDPDLRSIRRPAGIDRVVGDLARVTPQKGLTIDVLAVAVDAQEQDAVAVGPETWSEVGSIAQHLLTTRVELLEPDPLTSSAFGAERDQATVRRGRRHTIATGGGQPANGDRMRRFDESGSNRGKDGQPGREGPDSPSERTPHGTRSRSMRWLGSDTLESEAGLTDVSQALPRVLHETPLDEIAHVQRRRVRQRAEVGLVLEDRHDQVAEGVAFERALAGQALEEHAAKGPDVGAPIDGFAARLLGAHVRGRAKDHALGGQKEAVRLRARSTAPRCVGPDRFGEPEVEDLDGALRRDAHVGRLEIAVHDTGFVGGFESFGDLPADIERFIERQC